MLHQGTFLLLNLKGNPSRTQLFSSHSSSCLVNFLFFSPSWSFSNTSLFFSPGFSAHGRASCLCIWESGLHKLHHNSPAFMQFPQTSTFHNAEGSRCTDSTAMPLLDSSVRETNADFRGSLLRPIPHTRCSAPLSPAFRASVCTLGSLQSVVIKSSVWPPRPRGVTV